MTRYLTTTDPDGAHVLEAELPAVSAPGVDDQAESFEVGWTNDGDYGTTALIVEEELVVTEMGEPKSLPPRAVAPEPTEQSDAGRITGGISNAHPDLTFGEAMPVAEPAPEAEPAAAEEAEVAPEKPAASALKADWVDWVTANYEISVEDAEAMTKAELVETYGD